MLTYTQVTITITIKICSWVHIPDDVKWVDRPWPGIWPSTHADQVIYGEYIPVEITTGLAACIRDKTSIMRQLLQRYTCSHPDYHEYLKRCLCYLNKTSDTVGFNFFFFFTVHTILLMLLKCPQPIPLFYSLPPPPLANHLRGTANQRQAKLFPPATSNPLPPSSPLPSTPSSLLPSEDTCCEHFAPILPSSLHTFLFTSFWRHLLWTLCSHPPLFPPHLPLYFLLKTFAVNTLPPSSPLPSTPSSLLPSEDICCEHFAPILPSSLHTFFFTSFWRHLLWTLCSHPPLFPPHLPLYFLLKTFAVNTLTLSMQQLDLHLFCLLLTCLLQMLIKDCPINIDVFVQ